MRPLTPRMLQHAAAAAALPVDAAAIMLGAGDILQKDDLDQLLYDVAEPASQPPARPSPTAVHAELARTLWPSQFVQSLCSCIVSGALLAHCPLHCWHAAASAVKLSRSCSHKCAIPRRR